MCRPPAFSQDLQNKVRDFWVVRRPGCVYFVIVGIADEDGLRLLSDLLHFIHLLKIHIYIFIHIARQ